MALDVVIDRDSDVSAWGQIVRAIRNRIARGRFWKDEHLPSHRQLADDLGVAPATVKRAYDALKKQGFVWTAHGSGTTVSLPKVRRAEARRQIAPVVRRLIDDARLLGLSEEQLQELVSDAFDAANVEHRRNRDARRAWERAQGLIPEP